MTSQKCSRRHISKTRHVRLESGVKIIPKIGHIWIDFYIEYQFWVNPSKNNNINNIISVIFERNLDFEF